LKHPEYYKIGIKNQEFNIFQFLRWFLYAVWQSSFLLFIVLHSFANTTKLTDTTAITGSLFLDGTFVIETVVILVNVKLVLSTYNHTWVSVTI